MLRNSVFNSKHIALFSSPNGDKWNDMLVSCLLSLVSCRYDYGPHFDDGAILEVGT